MCESLAFQLNYRGDANGGYVDNHLGFDSHGDANVSSGWPNPAQFLDYPANLILWTDAANGNCPAAGGGFWVKRYIGGDCDANEDSGRRMWQFLSDGTASTSSGLCLTQYNLGSNCLVTKRCLTVSDE